MQTIITFILRMFTACFYTLVFLGVLAVVSFIVWAAEEQEKEKRGKK